jgi:lipid A 3-O-deacylase
MLVYRAVFAAIILIAAAPVSASAEITIEELRGGILAQGCCGQGTNKEDGVAINAEIVFASPKFLSVLGSPRPVVGASVATNTGATSQIYTSLEWRFKLSPRFFVSGGGGVAIHDGETDPFDPVADAARISTTLFLGCRALFRLNGNVGYQISDRVSAMFYWAHISNAGLCQDNEGLDHTGMRLGYSF